jgi:hypothetical protein
LVDEAVVALAGRPFFVVLFLVDEAVVALAGRPFFFLSFPVFGCFFTIFRIPTPTESAVIVVALSSTDLLRRDRVDLPQLETLL